MRPCGTFDEFYDQDMAICRTRFQWVVLIGGLIFLFGVYPQIADYYLLTMANIIGVIVIAALGLQILLGYCGQISLGHVAFVASGAYITAILTHHLGWVWIAALPCAIVGSALVGLLFGLPALRIRGFYIALSTMAAHFLIMWLILHGGDVTGAYNGLSVPPPHFGSIVISSEKGFFYLIMVVMVLATFLAKNLTRMKLGRAFIAIRDNDLAAEFMGINIFYYKLVAFSIASAYAGTAGALYASYLGMLTPGHFSFLESIWYLGYVIVGGMGSITGVYFGVIALQVLKQVVMIASPTIGAAVPAISVGVLPALMQIVFGLVIALFLIFEPRGLHHRWEVLKSSIRLWPFPY